MSTAEIILPIETGTGSRAIVRRDVEPVCVLQPIRTVRNDSSFVTQLIATAEDLPQTRLRRRAEPRDALAAYASPHDHVPTSSHTRRLA